MSIITVSLIILSIFLHLIGNSCGYCYSSLVEQATALREMHFSVHASFTLHKDLIPELCILMFIHKHLQAVFLQCFMCLQNSKVLYIWSRYVH